MKVIYLVTEARDNLFRLLKQVESGDEVQIVRKDNGSIFKVTLEQEEEKKTLSKMAILDEMAKINFKSGTPEEIKEVLVNRHNL